MSKNHYLTIFLTLFLHRSLADDAGWQWYNEAATEMSGDEQGNVNSNTISDNIKDKVQRLQQETKTSLYKAILYPDVKNFAEYFQMQNYWTQQAGLFAMSASKAMLEYPELDYNLQYSHYNGTVKFQLAADLLQQKAAIEELSQQYGILFFYRGKNPLDDQLAQIIRRFRENWNVSVISVSVDGVISPLLSDSRYNHGQAERLGVRHFPALMLVDPRSGNVKPLAYGFITQDDLAKQFLKVSSDFKPAY